MTKKQKLMQCLKSLDIAVSQKEKICDALIDIVGE